MVIKTKKVIMFIVEGPTDEDALSPVLKAVFQDENVRFHIVFGDITSDNKINVTEILKEVYEHIKQEMDRYGYNKGDIIKIVHLMDTDGAFIPEDRVVLSKEKEQGIKYTESKIICRNPKQIVERNRKKTIAVSRLNSAHKLGGIPYCILYFSRNLEHVLHNRDNDLSNDEKIQLADEFADKYTTDTIAFMNFISSSEFTVAGQYRETWEFIMQDANSLKRYSNLHLILTDKDLSK